MPQLTALLRKFLSEKDLPRDRVRLHMLALRIAGSLQVKAKELVTCQHPECAAYKRILLEQAENILRMADSKNGKIGNGIAKIQNHDW